MRKLIMRLEDWIDDDSFLISFIKLTSVLCVLIAPFVLYDAFHERSAMETCLASGGAWTVVGSEQQTTYNYYGKTVIPHTYTVRREGCVRR